MQSTRIKRKKDALTCLILLAIALTASSVLFFPGVPFGHDFSYHLTRIHSIVEGMRHGHVFMKVYPDLYAGYGYACGLFYGDIFLYIPALLAFCGIDLIISYKCFLFLIFASAALSAYIAAYSAFMSRRAGIVCAMLYVGSAYLTFDVYLRAALGEAQAFVFFPLAIAGVWRILHADERKIGMAVIGFSGLLLSHVISFLMSLGVALCLVAASTLQLWRQKKRVLYLCAAAGVALLLTAYFLFPMLEQMLFGGIRVQNTSQTGQMMANTIRIRDLFINMSGTPVMSPGVVMPGIGLLFLLVYPLRLAEGILRIKSAYFQDICLLLGTLSLLGATSLAPWNKLERIFAFLQFPWRLFLPACCMLALAAGGLIAHLAAACRYRRVVDGGGGPFWRL